MPCFCVNKNEQDNGDHEVHDLDADCDYTPAPSNQQALGNFVSCDGAVQKARDYFDQVNGCYTCANECHTG